MKKLVFSLMSLVLLSASVFAQSDLQPLAVVKLNKNESITVKQLKTRCEIYQKQMGIRKNRSLIQMPKQILRSLRKRQRTQKHHRQNNLLRMRKQHSNNDLERFGK